MKILKPLCAVFLTFAMAGCKVSSPGSLQTSVANEVKKRVTIGGKDWTNPIPDNPASRKEGQEHFGHHCQICHGLDGQNTGVPFATQMDPPVPDLTSPDVQEYVDGQLKWIVQNGISPSGMPAWNGILDDDEMWKIVRYLRHLPPKGSLGTPSVFKEEAEEHKSLEKLKPEELKPDESKPQESKSPHHHH